jgi:peptidyl-dipeptidase Dcp
MKKNPLLESTLPHGALPFPEITSQVIQEAFDLALKNARSRVAELCREDFKPEFQNTVVALDFCPLDLQKVVGYLQNQVMAESSEELRTLAQEILPQYASFWNDVFLNQELYRSIKRVSESRTLPSDEASKTLMRNTLRAFERNGATLSGASRERIRQIDSELTTLSRKFGDQLLADTQAFELWIPDEQSARLAGVPESAMKAARAEALRRNHSSGYSFTLSAPSFVPFMQTCEDRELREHLWRAQTRRGTHQERDNRGVLLEIVRLRHERAKLLGFEHHAAYVLEERMAGNLETVQSFLDRILSFALPAGKQEFEKLRAFSALEENIRPWDVAYFTEKLKQETLDLSDEALRPYFPYPHVLQGAFQHLRKLYDLECRERTDLPKYHPDVQVFEIFDLGVKPEKYMGLLYLDSFARPTKQGGAWKTEFQTQWGETRPHVAVVCSFPKAEGTTPSLLSYQDVRTLFHELGHALHELLSECPYPSLSGTRVYWDFVELPSQVFENWVDETESLAMISKHFETGETLPAEWIEKLRSLRKFQAGLKELRQLQVGLLDLAWHGRVPPTTLTPDEVESYEVKALEGLSFLPHEPGSLISPSFGHVFDGGYSAGYYSYKWAEVLDADAFSLFLERGIFDRTTARKFREEILSKGGTENPMKLYERFRGRKPDPDALLRRSGLHR